MFFCAEGNTSETDSAVAERDAATEAAKDGPVSQGARPVGHGSAAEGRIEVSREALDRLLAAGERAIRVLKRDVYPAAEQELRAAIAEITGGKGAWRATAGRSHCAMTGTWLEAREEAARLLGVPVASVTLRRLP